MNAFKSVTFSRKLALGLIVCALFGTEISYYLSQETRFEAIEQKLQQHTVALQQAQDAADTAAAAKNDSLAGLGRQVAALQASIAPLGKNAHDQTDSLAGLQQELASLQQAQTAQLEAQKRIAASLLQLEKSWPKAKPETAETSTEDPLPSDSSSGNAVRPSEYQPLPAARPAKPLPIKPSTNSAMDLRPSGLKPVPFHSVRALPVVASSGAN